MNNYYRKIRQGLKSDLFKELKREAAWIFKRLIKYKRHIVIFIITGLTGAFMGLAGNVITKYLIDAVTGYRRDAAGFYVALIITAAAINIIFKAVSSKYSAKVSIKVHNELQAEIFEKILDADWEEVSRYHSGDLLHRLSSDIGNIASGILSWFPSLIIQLVTLLATLSILFIYDPIMTLIAAICAPFSLLLSKLIMRKLRNYNSMMKQAGGEIMAFEGEALQNLQMIKCFNIKKLFNMRMKDIQKRYQALTIEYNRFSIYASSFLAIIGLIGSYAAFGWGVYRLWTGAITYGTMTLFLQLSGAISNSFSSLTALIPKAVDLLTCAGRVIKIYEIKAEDFYELSGDSDRTFNNSELTLELKNLDFSYNGGEKVLKSVYLAAEPGELIALIGPSGEGKSTLFKILLGLIRPDSGEARLYDHQDCVHNISAATRQFFSYVPQGNSIISGTIADNLRMVKPDATDEELISVLNTACIYSFIKELPKGIYTRVGERGLGLSEGQAQRIAIARALLRNAPILLLDEATSALDAETEAQVLKGIMEYGKSRICFIATHRSNVLAECSSIYRINNTRLTKYKDYGIKTVKNTASIG